MPEPAKRYSYTVSMDILVDVVVEAESEDEAKEKAKARIGEFHTDILDKNVTLLTDAPVNMNILGFDEVMEDSEDGQ